MILNYIKTLSLWASGIFFSIEIISDIILRTAILANFFMLHLSNSVTINQSIYGNLFSEILFITYLLLSIVFISELFKLSPHLNISSYRWIYILTLSFFSPVLIRYASNSMSIEKIFYYELDLLIIFVSISIFFFIQNAYRKIQKPKKS